jgi:alkylhydroperoxidase family enzyme
VIEGSHEALDILDDEIVAVLRFLKKLTLEPENVTADDLEILRKEGVSDEAIRTASEVCGLFCMINRIADTLEFEIPPNHNASVFILTKFGYK